jgi:3-phosphoshikimate 1-carboxyvinyltransferase
MTIKVFPSILMGEIEAPASKSSMQRALAAALLRKGETIIHNPGQAMMIGSAGEYSTAGHSTERLGAGQVAGKEVLQ